MKGDGIVATPIKDTPILYGKDSDRFLKEVEENEKKRLSKEEKAKSVDLYSKVMAKATFK